MSFDKLRMSGHLLEIQEKHPLSLSLSKHVLSFAKAASRAACLNTYAARR